MTCTAKPGMILHLESGYSRPEWTGTKAFRRVVVAELLKGPIQQEWPVLTASGKVVRARVSGQLKRWKRSPGRIRLPLKYGMYESFAVETDASTAQGDTVPYLLIEVVA